MKNFITKANLSGGDDSGTPTKWGAKESNSVTDELKLAVTATGQSLTAGTGNDPSPDLLSRALTITAQTAHGYQDSGAADAYVLTRTGSLEQPLSYIDRMRITFITANSNTGASTVNLSSLGSKKILLQDGSTALSGGEIKANEFVDLVYNSAADSSVGAFTTIKQNASETVAGVVELATDAEAQAYTANKIIDGDKLNNALKGANQSFLASGYQKLPGGLIIQWGLAIVPAANSTATFSYPIAFPNLDMALVCVAETIAASDLNEAFGAATSISLSQFSIRNYYNSSGLGFSWIAIGY